MNRGRPPGSTKPEERVRHQDTFLEGDVLSRTIRKHGAPHFAGDQAGTWINVLWDDGFQCEVPERNVTFIP